MEGIKGVRESWRGGEVESVERVEGRDGRRGKKKGRERKCFETQKGDRGLDTNAKKEGERERA